MDNSHQNPKPGKWGGKASRGQAEGDRSNAPELFAYSIDDVIERVPFGRSTIYEEIKAGRLIARKVRGRTLILPADLTSYLAALPTAKHGAEPAAA